MNPSLKKDQIVPMEQYILVAIRGRKSILEVSVTKASKKTNPPRYSFSMRSITT